MSKKEKYIRVMLYSLLFWLFNLISYFIFLAFKIHLFNYEIITYSVGSLILLALMIDYFKRVKEKYIYEGFFIGIIWSLTIMFLSIPFIYLITSYSRLHGSLFNNTAIKRIFLHQLVLLVSILITTGIGYLLDYKSK